MDKQLKARELNQWTDQPLPKPAHRLICIGCNKRLAVQLEDIATFQERMDAVRSGKGGMRNYTGRWRYNSEGHFHSQSCAANWANKEIDKYVHQSKNKN